MKALMLLSVFFVTNAICGGLTTHLAEDAHDEVQMLNSTSHDSSSIRVSQKTNALSTDSRDFQLTGYKPPIIDPQLDSQTVCESLVCESIKQAEPVPVIGDVPKREGNKTIEALTSAIYIAGEVGLADNHAEPDSEIGVLD